MSKKLIITVGAIVVTASAVALIGPPAAAADCKKGINTLIVTAATDGTLTDESWSPTANDLPLSCRVTSEEKRKTIAAEVISENMGLIVTSAFADAFAGMGEETAP